MKLYFLSFFLNLPQTYSSMSYSFPNKTWYAISVDHTVCASLLRRHYCSTIWEKIGWICCNHPAGFFAQFSYIERKYAILTLNSFLRVTQNLNIYLTKRGSNTYTFLFFILYFWITFVQKQAHKCICNWWSRSRTTRFRWT